MLIKWIYFAILVPLILVDSKHAKDVDTDEDIESKPCIHGQCDLTNKKKKQLFTEEVSTNKPNEETTTRKEEEDEIQPNGFDLVKLITMLANNKHDGKTKIAFNVRDIQSGFRNTGSKYHVGNVHKERNRDKRDTESVLEDTSTDADGETGVAITTETTTDYAQSEDRSLELVRQSTTENYLANNDNKSVNVVQSEADNFQDSNVTGIYDSVANDSTTESVEKNEESDFKNNFYNSNEQNGNIEANNDNSIGNLNNNTVLPVENNSNSFLNKTWSSTSESVLLGIESKVSDEETVIGGNLRSQINQTQLPKVKIALSSKDLNSIQNVLSDDLGVKSKGANPVANFSLNGPLDNKNDNAVIVIVYNCSCDNKDTHAHDNTTKKDVTGTDDIDVKNVLNTRRMLSNDEPIFSSAQIDVTPEVTITENTAKVYNARKVDDKTNNAILENELLRKCNSLLALQQANKVKEASDTIVDSIYSDSSNIAKNVDNSEIENESNTFNNGVAIQKNLSDNGLNSSQLQINNVENDSQDDFTTDIVNQAVSLDSENIITEASNLDTVVKVLSERKRRSMTKDNVNSLQKENTIYRDKRGVADVINELFQYFMIVPDNYTEDTAVKSNVQRNEINIHEKKHIERKSNSQTNKVIKESKNGERKRRNARKNSLNSHENKRSKRDIVDYVKKHYVIEPNHSADDYKYSKEKSSYNKREIKIPRHPKYYDYTNDRMNLLEPVSSPNENDATIVNFKSLNNYAALPYDDSYLNAVNFVLSKENLPTYNKDIPSKNILRLKPIYVNVYVQSLMKNFEKYQQNNN